MGATLEQALLDEEVLNFVCRPGMCRGDAVITLKTEDAAVRCAKHFHGRRWDVSGIMVTAKLLSEETNQHKPVQSSGYVDDLVADPYLDDLQILSRYEARIDKEGGWDDRNQDTFGADSCDHDDLVAQVFAGADSTHSSKLSAAAPEFVPGKMLTAVSEVVVAAGSDVSTASEDGESVSSCDEKDSVVALTKGPAGAGLWQ